MISKIMMLLYFNIIAIEEYTYLCAHTCTHKVNLHGAAHFVTKYTTFDYAHEYKKGN